MIDIQKLMAKVKDQKEAIEARKAGGAATAKIPAGRSRWRILPGWRKDEPETFTHPYGAHWIKDAAGQVVAVYVCDYETFGKSCDFCAPLRAAIRSTKDDATLKLLKEMNAGKRYMVNAIQIDGQGADPGKVVLVELPVSVHDAYVAGLYEGLAEEINFLDPNEGRDLIIEKTGTGMNTRYSATFAAKSTKVDPARLAELTDIDAWIKAQRDSGLSKGVAPLNEAIERVLTGGIGGDAGRAPSLVGGGAGTTRAVTSGTVSGAPALAAPVVAATTGVVAGMIAEKPVPVSAGDDAELDKLLEDLV